MYNFRDQHRLPQGVGIGEAQIVQPVDSGVDMSLPAKLAYQERVRKEEQAKADKAAAAKAEADRIKGLPKPDDIKTSGILPAMRGIIQEEGTSVKEQYIEAFRQYASNGGDPVELDHLYGKIGGNLIGAIEDLQLYHTAISKANQNAEKYDEPSRKLLKTLQDPETYKKMRAEGKTLGDISAFIETSIAGLSEEPEAIDLSDLLKVDAHLTDTKKRSSAQDDGAIYSTEKQSFSPRKARLAAESKYDTATDKQKLALTVQSGLKDRQAYIDNYVKKSEAASKGKDLQGLTKPSAGGGKDGGAVVTEQQVSETPVIDHPRIKDPRAEWKREIARNDELIAGEKDKFWINRDDKLIAKLEADKVKFKNQIDNYDSSVTEFQFSKSDGSESKELQFGTGIGDAKTFGVPQKVLYNKETNQAILQISRKDATSGVIDIEYIPIDKNFSTAKLKTEYPAQMANIEKRIKEIRESGEKVNKLGLTPEDEDFLKKYK